GTDLLDGRLARGGVIATEPLGQVFRHRGEASRARDVVKAVLPEELATSPGGALFGEALAAQRLPAAPALHADRPATPRARLEAHDRWIAWGGAVLGRSEGQELWARLIFRCGDVELARRHAGLALTHAAEPRQPLALLAAHRLLGELAGAAGCHDEARAHL